MTANISSSTATAYRILRPRPHRRYNLASMQTTTSMHQYEQGRWYVGCLVSVCGPLCCYGSKPSPLDGLLRDPRAILDVLQTLRSPVHRYRSFGPLAQTDRYTTLTSLLPHPLLFASRPSLVHGARSPVHASVRPQSSAPRGTLLCLAGVPSAFAFPCWNCGDSAVLRISRIRGHASVSHTRNAALPGGKPVRSMASYASPSGLP
ncbi:uncharacterized protein C8Q71DRAFT_379649 [Rhodofomes roseus]|uniref:C2H2-type domain-containing protein n=1 Tax=Rhodofomes roseus TaxID=34475 RepID=A0ABQ8K128_9APHY|nr:uncharacterized protein C8Q71DRAFT_379649 [Rhodofomes roseus]KAH9830136.1 hypothetical protein C8Q71DRAFT_379649 [Rhodofomes roseus]